MRAVDYCPWCDDEGCERCGGDTIQRRFEEFHRNNPEVYALLLALARDWRNAHKTRRVGIARLIEVVRWDMDVKVRPNGDGFKINNNFRSRYARLIMERNPDLEGMFEIREIRSE